MPDVDPRPVLKYMIRTAIRPPQSPKRVSHRDPRESGWSDPETGSDNSLRAPDAMLSPISAGYILVPFEPRGAVRRRRRLQVDGSFAVDAGNDDAVPLLR